jgi:hypothetical protein
MAANGRYAQLYGFIKDLGCVLMRDGTEAFSWNAGLEAKLKNIKTDARKPAGRCLLHVRKSA